MQGSRSRLPESAPIAPTLAHGSAGTQSCGLVSRFRLNPKFAVGLAANCSATSGFAALLARARCALLAFPGCAPFGTNAAIAIDARACVAEFTPNTHRREVMLLESIETGVDVAAAQWQARVDLAASHRLAVMHGFNEGIFNHFTLRVPGTNDRYYQIPFGLHWTEVTASCFMEIGYDGTRHSGEGEIERSAFAIHAPIHRLAQHGAAVFHTHMPFVSARSRLEDQRILPIGQTELAISMHTAY